MIVKIIIESIIYSLLYFVFMLILFNVQRAKYQLYNYPPAIKKRAIEKGIITQEQLNINAKKNKSTDDCTVKFRKFSVDLFFYKIC